MHSYYYVVTARSCVWIAAAPRTAVYVWNAGERKAYSLFRKYSDAVDCLSRLVDQSSRELHCITGSHFVAVFETAQSAAAAAASIVGVCVFCPTHELMIAHVKSKKSPMERARTPRVVPPTTVVAQDVIHPNISQQQADLHAPIEESGGMIFDAEPDEVFTPPAVSYFGGPPPPPPAMPESVSLQFSVSSKRLYPFERRMDFRAYSVCNGHIDATPWCYGDMTSDAPWDGIPLDSITAQIKACVLGGTKHLAVAFNADIDRSQLALPLAPDILRTINGLDSFVLLMDNTPPAAPVYPEVTFM
jgi:hypothetical protein